MTRRVSLAALLLCALAAQSRVYTGSRAYIPHEVRLHAETNIVQMAVTVRDNRGQPVAGLSAADFKLFDRGKPQSISGFSVELSAPEAASGAAHSPSAVPVPSAQPQSVALYFDDNSMGTADLMMARSQAERYLRRGVPGGQQIGVFTSSGVHQLAFTNDADAVSAAVHKLGVEVRMGPTGQAIGPLTIDPYVAYLAAERGQVGLLATELRDAKLCFDPIACHYMATAEAQSIFEQTEEASSDTFAALREAIAALGRQPGRRTLLLTSDGFLSEPSELRVREEEVIKAALQNGVVINTLDATLLQSDDPTQSPQMRSLRLAIQEGRRDPLYDLAAATGGEFFHDNNDLASALRSYTDGPRVRYMLSFSPSDMKNDGAFHAVSVKLAQGTHGEVQTRKGYYDPDPTHDPFAVLPQALLDRELLGTDDQVSLSAAATVNDTTAADGTRRLAVSIHVDAARLPFIRQAGFSGDDLGFAVAVFDLQGKFIAGKQGVMELRLTKEARAQIEKTGVAGNLSLTLPPGAYRLRGLVRESNRGAMATITRAVNSGP